MPKSAFVSVPKAALLSLLLAGASPVMAQESGAAEPAGEASEEPGPATESAGEGSGGGLGEPPLGTPVAPDEPGPGDVYVADTFGDWQLRCVIVEEGAEPCELFQVLSDATGNPTAEVTIFALPEGGQAVAGATILTPLRTLLTENLRLRVDSGETARYPFVFCEERGCFSRLGFSAADVGALRRGAVATVTIVPVVAPDRDIDLAMSLTGFTAGFEALSGRSAAEN